MPQRKESVIRNSNLFGTDTLLISHYVLKLDMTEVRKEMLA